MVESYGSLTVADLREGRFSDEEAERLLAAEEGQWGLSLLQGVGALEGIPVNERDGFFRVVQKKWLDLAVSTGIMPQSNPLDEPIYEPGPVPGFLY